jgi:hypothetical protein
VEEGRVRMGLLVVGEIVVIWEDAMVEAVGV